MATNTVTTTWKENMQFETDNPSGHTITIDTSAEHGGSDNGLRPKSLMLSSLAGCSGLDIVSLLKKMRAEADDFKIEVTGELTEEHPKFYHKVQVDYHFTGSNLKEDKIEFINVKRFKDEHIRGLYENGYFEWPLAPIIQNLMKHQLSNNKQLPILFSYQYADFTNLEKRRLLGHDYTISSKLDKMGVRLNGPSIITQSPVLTSQPMANGAIQIPGNGRPIVMRNNRQTIGGYPVIGVVNSVGLAILSQCVASQNISFTLTNIESSNISKSFIDLQLNQVLNNLRSFISISH